MNKLHRLIWIIGLNVLSFSSLSLALDRVALLTDQASLNNQRFKASREFSLSIHVLGAVGAWSKRYSVSLSGNPTEAQSQFSRIWRTKRKDIQLELISAYQPVLFAMANGITRFPAVIINQQYVVYGVNDAERAYKIYLDWVNSEGGKQQ